MGDLKNKFMDILFEDENEEVINDSNDGEAKPKQSESSIKASDILYHKANTSAFIDLEESPKSAEELLDEPKEYELSAQISPIFGIISKEKKKVNKVDPEVVETQTTKPADSHLDIITSPIYGYGNKEDAMDNNYDVKGINEDEDEELHHLFDQNEGIDVMNNDSLDEDEISLFRLFGEDK